MDFYALVDQVANLLQQRGRVTYRSLRRQFELDDEALDDLKDELLFSHPVVDEESRGLVWTGEPAAILEAPPAQTVQQEHPRDAQPTPAELPQAQPSASDAERRQLTVMFCDLADSTRLSSQLDPEDLRDVLRAYQSSCTEVIERFGGYIAQHLGDGLMVYLGWPQAHEDDAQRAVHAGLGILNAMQGLNSRLQREKGMHLAVRIGIHTGLVVVGEIGQGASQEHLALGETPNIASRIEGIAEPDTLVISGATYQLIQGYFVCEDLGRHALKGVGERQQVYRVVNASGAQGRLDVGASRGLTPLVGRESESTLLFERWAQVKGGQGQVVSLSGEAGIGKSRLLQVMKDHVAEDAHTLLECRSSPYYQNSALYPITDMLPQAFDWQQDDTPQAKLERLEQTLRQYNLAPDETIPLYAELLGLSIPEDRYPPLTMSPQQQRQQTLQAIVRLLLAQAEQRPLLFILEDLHWTDPSTLELLELFIDQTPAVAIFVLLTCRPTFQPPWSSRSYLGQMTLNRLFRSQIERMVDRVAGGKRLPADVLQQIVEKTDGVPLYVEEMTKAVLDSGYLTDVDGHYALTGPVASLAIPATLQDSLMARLDQLVDAKAVAQYAAVIGRQFSYDLLQALSQLDEPILQHALGRLVDAELLYQRGLPPQATYTFKHALIQDAAYQSLLKSTRQAYHQRIAQVLERRFPETIEMQPELLAHHYTEAGRSETAIRYWQQAGQQASQRSAYAEAMSHLSKGLELLEMLPDKIARLQQEVTLQVSMGVVLNATKGVAAPEVEHAYLRAREICHQLGDASPLFQVLQGLGGVYVLRAELQKAAELAAQLHELAKRDQDPALLLEAYHLEWCLYYLGALTETRACVEQGLALYNSLKHRLQALQYYGHDPGVCCLAHKAFTEWVLGYPEQALQSTDEMLQLAQDLSHPQSLALALAWAARLYQLCRQPAKGQAQAQAAVSLSAAQGFARPLAEGTFMTGWALSELGDRAAGMVQMRQGLEGYRGTAAQLWQPYFMALLAEGYGADEQAQTGLRLLDEAIRAVDKTGERVWAAELYRLQGELLLNSNGELRDGELTPEDCFQHALAIARRQQAKSWELRTATSLARLWLSQGKHRDAYELLAPVYTWFTEGFDQADLLDAKTLLNELAP